MKWTCSILVVSLTLALAPALQGQVSVAVDLDQNQFLEHESMPVKVRITNLSGATLHLGQDNDWLVFSISSRSGQGVSKLGKVPVQGEFSMGSSRVASRLVELGPYFDLEPGRYHLTAHVRIKQWNQEVSSEPQMIEVLRGTRIWEQAVGVPQPAGPPAPRLFALIQADYLKSLHLYARVSDASEEKVFRVFPLGRLVSFGRPEVQIDEESKMHVLFQTGPRSFTYCVVNPQGVLLTRQRHDYYGDSRPRLFSDFKTGITVEGGVRRPTANDLPSPSYVSSTNDVPSVTTSP
jgi:hypothetical protein